MAEAEKTAADADANTAQVPDLSAKIATVVGRGVQTGLFDEKQAAEIKTELSDPNRALDYLGHAMKVAADNMAALEASKGEKTAQQLGQGEAAVPTTTEKTALDKAGDDFVTALQNAGN